MSPLSPSTTSAKMARGKEADARVHGQMHPACLWWAGVQVEAHENMRTAGSALLLLMGTKGQQQQMAQQVPPLQLLSGQVLRCRPRPAVLDLKSVCMANTTAMCNG